MRPDAAIAEIAARSRRHLNARFERGPGWIAFRAADPSGFDVTFAVEDDDARVSFDGWHEHFPASEIENALNCFAFGLSEDCRLVIHRRGGFSYRWIVEALTDGDWVPESETGLLIFPFWRRRSVEIRQNHLIKHGDSPGTD